MRAKATLNREFTISTVDKRVYGSFLEDSRRQEFAARIRRLKGRVETINFHSRMEDLYAGAIGVVAMGGYNTFCEILSFDKPSVLAPRTRPRLEQRIRAEAAEALGLLRVNAGRVALQVEGEPVLRPRLVFRVVLEHGDLEGAARGVLVDEVLRRVSQELFGFVGRVGG